MPQSKPSSRPPEFFSPHVRAARRFYLNLAPPVDARLAVVCGGWEACAPDYAIHRPTFAYCSIEFVARGRGTVWLAGRQYPLAPGVVFAYAPGVSQDITTDPRQPLEKYFVDFAGTAAQALLERNGLAPGTLGRVAAPAEMQALFDALIADALRESALADALCSTLLEYMLTKLSATLVPLETGQTPAFATYERCRAHLAEHFRSIPSLADAARQCHVDAAYLCRLFRRYGRETPYRFLLRAKMNYAAERIRSSGVLVKQVSAELGFSDPFHFSRAFKTIFGISPDAFRRLR